MKLSAYWMEHSAFIYHFNNDALMLVFRDFVWILVRWRMMSQKNLILNQGQVRSGTVILGISEHRTNHTPLSDHDEGLYFATKALYFPSFPWDLRAANLNFESRKDGEYVQLKFPALI
jgi:hypothetical protein